MKAEYNSNEITAKNVTYNKPSIYENSDGYIQSIGSCEQSSSPVGLSLIGAYGYHADNDGANIKDMYDQYGSFGTIIHLKNDACDIETELFIQGISSGNSINGNSMPPIFIRSRSDAYSKYGVGWCAWKRIAYYDDIENILREKGLIK